MYLVITVNTAGVLCSIEFSSEDKAKAFAKKLGNSGVKFPFIWVEPK